MNWNDPLQRRKYYTEYRRTWREEHPEQSRASCRAQYWKNPAKHRERVMKYRKSIDPIIRKMHESFLYWSNIENRKRSWRKYYHSKREFHRSRGAKWAKENKALVSIHNKNRKHLTKAISGQSCVEKLKLLMFDRFCHWCCIGLTPKNRTVDHVTPLSRSGRHIPDNLVSSCSSCNSSKGSKLVSEWEWRTV